VSVLESTDIRLDAERDIERIHSRASRIARSIRKLPVHQTGHAVIACCADHLEDRHVALEAARLLGLNSFVVVNDGRHDELPTDTTLVLACGEGLAGIEPTTGIIVSDVPGTYWWKLLELRGGLPEPEVLEDR
jgi:hypothetical protein